MSRIIFFTLIICCTSYGQSDSIAISGNVTNSISKNSIKGVSVIYVIGYGKDSVITNTDKTGEFQITIPRTKHLNYLSFVHPDYLKKNINLSHLELKKNLNIKIRERKIAKTSTNLDSSLIGKSVSKILKTLELEINDLHIIYEPPGICRGFEIELGDSSFVKLYIERFGGHNPYKGTTKVFRKPMIGYCIASMDGKTVNVGTGIRYQCFNEYVIWE
jgi:hypothetical protein